MEIQNDHISIDLNDVNVYIDPLTIATLTTNIYYVNCISLLMILYSITLLTLLEIMTCLYSS